MQPNKEKLWVDEHCSNSKRTLCCMEGQTRVGVASVFTPPKDIIGWHGPGYHILAFWPFVVRSSSVVRVPVS
jgi:hypothetical protein